MSQTTASAAPASTTQLSHHEIVEVLFGLLSAMFTAVISSTIVSNALPTIIADLDGTQSQYTWVVTTALLATTVSTPVWAKLSDLIDKKLLVEVALAIFVVASVTAGFSVNVTMLLVCRGGQGLAMGGLMSLGVSIIGSVIPPRERGRYSGYMGAVMAVATVSGPLIGGVIVDTPFLGWRWTFFVCVPLAVVASYVLHRYLRVQFTQREVRLDLLGALLIGAAAALPLLWVTFAGESFAWVSWETAAFLGGTLVCGLLAVWQEARHPEPLVPLWVVRERTTALSVLASVAVGIGLFGGAVFLGLYFQYAHGYSPTAAGLLSAPMMIGSLVGTAGTGTLITRTGRWKRYLVAGALLLCGSLALMSTIDHTTAIWHVSIFMFGMGVGMGCLMQNLVLVVQNTVDVTQVGAASGVVTFSRSLGGAMGVGVLGAILASTVKDNTVAGLTRIGVDPRVMERAGGSSSGSVDINALPGPIQTIVRAAYGDAVGHIFVFAAAVAVVTVVAVLLIREVPLRTTLGKADGEQEDVPVNVPSGELSHGAAAVARHATVGDHRADVPVAETPSDHVATHRADEPDPVQR